MNLEDSKKVYEASITRYNFLIDKINELYGKLVYLEQFPVVIGEFVDNNQLDKVLDIGSKVNDLDVKIKDAKSIIKKCVNDTIDQFNVDLTENSNLKIDNKISFVSPAMSNDDVIKINDITNSYINDAIEFAKNCDEELARKLSNYAAIMKVLITERSKNI